MDKNNEYYIQEAIRQMKETVINADNEMDLVPHSISNENDTEGNKHFFTFERVFSISAPDSIKKYIHIFVNIGYEENICDVIIEDENCELASFKIEDNFEILNDLRNVILENMCVEKNAKIYTFPAWAMAYLEDALATSEEQKIFEENYYKLSTLEEFQNLIDTYPWIKEKIFKLRDDSTPAIWTTIIASLHGILEYELNREELVIEEIQEKLKKRRALFSQAIQMLTAKDLTQLGNSYIESDVLDSRHTFRYDKNSSIARWKDNNV